MSERRIVDGLPAGVRGPVEKAIGWLKNLSRPMRVLIASTALALALLGSWLAFRDASPPYTTLFTNLERDDAAMVVAKLKELKVPYRLQGDGAVIEVPEDKARELRLELAGAGLPRGGAVGFESFDKMRLGATEFEQRILYRRALEGELARTIGSIAAVQSARVHVVLPEKSVFVSRSEASSASVVVKLRPGRTPSGSEVATMVHLVSTAVAGLSPDRVAVVTTDGAVLHKPKRPGDDGSGDDDRASQARSLEATLEERARALVEKVTGPGHVDVRVTADIDSARVERVEDRYDPRQPILRSEEQSIERTGEGEIPVAGVPGAESNLPDGTAKNAARAADAGAPAATAAASGVTRESHTRNFEVDHVVEKRVLTGGVLRRVTVAVVIDGTPGADEKQRLERIASLVRSAVGYDEKRGDVVTVEAVPFLAPPAELPEPPAESLLARIPPKKALPYAAGIMAAFVIAVTVAAVRRRRRRAAAKVLALAAAKERAAAEAVAVEILPREAKIESGEELRRLVRERARLDPATAASIVRSWLGSADAARDEAA